MSLLCTLLVAPLLQSAPPEEPGEPFRPRNVAIVVFAGVELLDFAGPGEVFASAHAPEGMAFHVYTVADRPDPIVSQGFVRITPQYTYENCPAPDIVVVPGGSVPIRSESLRAWLTACAETSELVMSVCNGASALAVTGLLDGLEATTHRSALRSVQILAPEATVLENRRFVDNGRILTCAGVSAGIDGALHVVERLHGTEVARATATYMEYDWRPEVLAELHAQPGQPVAGPAFEVLELLRTRGAEATLADRRRRASAGEPVASEDELNRLGYGLLNADRRDEALQVFELVAATFPASANACDSLAEAYEFTGRDTDALTWSVRGLELFSKDSTLTGERAEHVREALEGRAARLRSGETAGAWACPPCGQACDGKRLREPGRCPNEACGMELVRVAPDPATE